MSAGVAIGYRLQGRMRSSTAMTTSQPGYEFEHPDPAIVVRNILDHPVDGVVGVGSPNLSP